MEILGNVYHGHSDMHLRDSPTPAAMQEVLSEHLTKQATRT